MRHIFLFLSLLLTGQCGSVCAGDWTPRPQAIQNLASGYAFAVLCAAHGHSNTGPVAHLGDLYKHRLTDSVYTEWRDIYQRALHEKKVYSIAGSRWVPFKVTENDCKGVDGVVDILIFRLESGLTE